MFDLGGQGTIPRAFRSSEECIVDSGNGGFNITFDRINGSLLFSWLKSDNTSTWTLRLNQ